MDNLEYEKNSNDVYIFEIYAILMMILIFEFSGIFKKYKIITNFLGLYILFMKILKDFNLKF